MDDEPTFAALTTPDAVTAAGCGHAYAESRQPCPHLAAPEADRCVWHNAAVRKGDAYVARLVAAAAASARGDLAEARLAGLSAPGIGLPGADLRRADLRDAALDGADLAQANLAGAVLRRASLRRARLAGANLGGADLAGSNLTGADLSGADLTGALIDGTVLNGADLAGADLTGAEVRSFRWNRRTRFDGVRGFNPSAGIGDSTAPHPAVAGSAFADDPEDDRTREFTVVKEDRLPTVAASDLLAPEGANTPPTPAPSRRGPWMATSLVACLLAAAGVGFGAWGLRTASARPADATRIAAERDAALRQAEADLAEVRKLQGRAAQLEEAMATARTEAQRAKDEALVRRSEAEDARKRLTATETDALRLRDADDRAAIMALKLADAQRLVREQAAEMSRQERLGGILSAGVRQLGDENGRLTKTVDTRVAEEHRADRLAADVAKLTQENEGLKADRDAMASRERQLTADLADSRHAIQARARVAEANLDSVLGDGTAKVPLVPIKPGAPIALSGDYLISLRLDPVDGGVAAKLVVQRPAGVANPDVSIVLYDRDERPLRRLGFGFPHVDAGAPFASASATVACEQFPAFARVIVSPAATPPVGKR